MIFTFTLAWVFFFQDLLPSKKVQRKPSGSKSRVKGSQVGAAHRERRIFRCTDCEFRANESGRLRRHEERHRIRSTYRCPLCSFSSSLKMVVTGHLHRNHSETKSTIAAKKAKKAVDKIDRTAISTGPSLREVLKNLMNEYQHFH